MAGAVLETVETLKSLESRTEEANRDRVEGRGKEGLDPGLVLAGECGENFWAELRRG